MNIPAQIFGIVALIFTVVAIQFNNKTKVLRCHIVANVFYSLQYLMLDAYSGLFISIIGLIRSIIFNKFTIKNKKVPLFALVIILFFILYSGYLSYNGLLSTLPIFNGVIYSFILWQQNLKQFRVVSIFCAIIWLIYNVMVGAYVGFISSALELIFAILAFIRIDILKKNEKQG